MNYNNVGINILREIIYETNNIWGTRNMPKKLMSIRTAVILPFVAIMVMIIAVFVVLWQKDYNWLVKEQGGKMIHAMSDNTKQRVTYMLSEPLRINKLYEQVISKDGLYGQASAEAIQDYTLDVMKSLSQDLPQISVISYGDENGNFIGYRKRSDEKGFDLMLKDSRTTDLLNIYDGETIYDPIVGSYEGYDPTSRPWYAPVKENQRPQWSDIYINMDEKMEATLSTLVPVFDKQNVFKGVADIDVKLSGINTFLKNDRSKGNGAIYIIDSDWRIIAHSMEESNVKITAANPPEGELLQAVDSQNQLIRSSAGFLQSQNIALDQVVTINNVNNKQLALISKLDEPKGLDWRIVIVLPESDLMGLVKQRQMTTIILMAVLVIVVTLLGMFTISKVISPILNASAAAREINVGNWETGLKTSGLNFYETDNLISAFNMMISRLKDTFHQITVSEEKYRALVENVDNMIYSLTPEGKFISINNSFEKSIGRKREDVIGKDAYDIFETQAEKDYWSGVVANIQKTKQKMNFQYEIKNNDATSTYLNVNLMPILDNESNVIMILGSNMDITELILAQNEINRMIETEKENLEIQVAERTNALRMAMDELVEKEKMASLGSLVSGISHEINTPLGVSVSAGSYLEKLTREITDKLDANEITKSDFIQFIVNLQESISIINTNLNRAAELVRSFKEIAVKQSIEGRIKFNVYDYFSATILSLKHEYKNASHQIVLNCNKALEIVSFPGAFSQILTNLMMNSIIHGFENSEGGLIAIDVSLNDQLLRIDYSDNGKGISNEHVSKIFDPFFTTNRNKGGSGLGLNIVYNIVTSQLNGKIHCTSELEKGTKFTIEINLEAE